SRRRPLHGCRHTRPLSRADPAAPTDPGGPGRSGGGSGRMFGGSGHRARTAPGSLRAERAPYSFPSSPVRPWYRTTGGPGGSSVVGAGTGCYGRSAMARERLTAKELEELRDQLERERTELQSQLAEIEASTFSQAQSDLSGEMAFDDEPADAGTATFERERDLSLENNVRDLLGKIEKALTRMDEGTYGTCERCGK